MGDVKDELDATDPKDTFKANFSGYIKAGVPAQQAAELAAYQAHSIEVLKNSVPKNINSLTERLRFSKLAHSLSSIKESLERLDFFTATDADLQAIRMVLGEDAYKEIQRSAQQMLDERTDLLQLERKFLEKVVGGSDNKALLYQQAAHSRGQAPQSQRKIQRGANEATSLQSARQNLGG
jgi:hypothetical protein